MFTGIIETQGIIKECKKKGGNKTFWLKSPISKKLKVDQSVSHDGVCLTIEKVKGNQHCVTAIAETLLKSNLESWEPGYLVNLERSLKVSDRLDGHFVQGHVDVIATCTKKVEKEGSWQFSFQIPDGFNDLIIEKGSISINGISLTLFNVSKNNFDVAIIPYTYYNTNIKTVVPGLKVNLEFDILGKYINRKKSIANS